MTNQIEPKRVEYESLRLGDRVQTTTLEIGKVIRIWRYRDGSGSFYNLRLDGDSRNLTEDDGVYINFDNYLRTVSVNETKED